MQLQKAEDELKAIGVQVVAVSYDSPKVLAEFAKKSNVTLPLLSDPESKVITAYGVLNEKAKGRQKGIPNPGTFLVGKDGTIEAVLIKGGYIFRHTPMELIDAAKRKK